LITIKELSNLSGRRALITGAAGNLGKVMAATLAELGSDLVLVDLNDSDFVHLSESLITRWGVKVDCYACNLEQQEQRTKLIDDLIKGGLGLNILINNAAFTGTSDLGGWCVPFKDQSTETFRQALEVNLISAFDLCRGLKPLLDVANGASVINIASIYAELGPDWALYEGTAMGNPAAYGASKGGLVQLTRWLATTLAPNIRVNAISPGGISRGQPESFVRRYEAKTPLGRMATEEDFCGIIAFLASDLSKYVTGQNFSVDGGWGVW
jgi:NAD(P)-dependent dehydrogenase (short-subunit alcohol dehydrogenase family)